MDEHLKKLILLIEQTFNSENPEGKNLKKQFNLLSSLALAYRIFLPLVVGYIKNNNAKLQIQSSGKITNLVELMGFDLTVIHEAAKAAAKNAGRRDIGTANFSFKIMKDNLYRLFLCFETDPRWKQLQAAIETIKPEGDSNPKALREAFAYVMQVEGKIDNIGQQKPNIWKRIFRLR